MTPVTTAFTKKTLSVKSSCELSWKVKKQTLRVQVKTEISTSQAIPNPYEYSPQRLPNQRSPLLCALRLQIFLLQLAFALQVVDMWEWVAKLRILD